MSPGGGRVHSRRIVHPLRNFVGQGRDIESAWKDAAGIIVGDDKCLESAAGSADERLMVTQDATVGDVTVEHHDVAEKEDRQCRGPHAGCGQLRNNSVNYGIIQCVDVYQSERVAPPRLWEVAEEGADFYDGKSRRSEQNFIRRIDAGRPVYLKKLARWNKLVNCAIPRDADTEGRDTLLKIGECCTIVSGEPLGEQISFIVGSKTTVLLP